MSEIRIEKGGKLTLPPAVARMLEAQPLRLSSYSTNHLLLETTTGADKVLMTGLLNAGGIVDLLSPARGAPDPNTYMPPPRFSPRAYSRSWLAALMLTGSCAAACCFRAATAWSFGLPSTMSGVGRFGVAGAVPVYLLPPYDAVHHVVPSGF